MLSPKLVGQTRSLVKVLGPHANTQYPDILVKNSDALRRVNSQEPVILRGTFKENVGNNTDIRKGTIGKLANLNQRFSTGGPRSSFRWAAKCSEII